MVAYARLTEDVGQYAGAAVAAIVISVVRFCKFKSCPHIYFRQTRSLSVQSEVSLALTRWAAKSMKNLVFVGSAPRPACSK